MTTRRRSAYELPFAHVDLTAAEQHQALAWWQSGADFYPLRCPVCGATLDVADGAPKLRCPTTWCSFATDEVPWGVYVAWRQSVGAGEDTDDQGR